ncbi:MAG: potassium channel family protein [Minisyncoccia bacterium]
MLTFLYTLYRFGRGIRAGLHDPDFQALLWLAMSILAIGTVTYHATEKWGWIDSLYFSVTTLTTIGGYGTLYPHTEGGKLFTILYILVGIGILLGFINALAEHALRDTREHPGIIGRSIIRRRKKVSTKVVPETEVDPAQQKTETSVEKTEEIK